jgi:hypothetical protein
MEYTPHGENKIILDEAFRLVQSVPYRVSSRWLFYKLLQKGFYSTKEDYKGKWTPILSMARKREYNGWRRDTIEDDTRWRIPRTGFYMSVEHVVKNLPDAISNSINLTIDHFYRQEVYVELWFEARAMAKQFMHYTKGIDLVPFGGDPSIPLKNDTAKHLENCAGWYGTPLQVLYFGDLDTKGGKIYESAVRDVQEWCSEPIQVTRCGLTLEQVQKYDLPENFEKPGQYQWEALEDWQAREIIEAALPEGRVPTVPLWVPSALVTGFGFGRAASSHLGIICDGLKSTKLDLSLIEECEQQGNELTDLWRKKTKKLIERELKKKPLNKERNKG